MNILGLFVGEKKKSCADVEKMASLCEVQFMSSMYTFEAIQTIVLLTNCVKWGPDSVHGPQVDGQ